MNQRPTHLGSRISSSMIDASPRWAPSLTGFLLVVGCSRAIIDRSSDGSTATSGGGGDPTIAVATVGGSSVSSAASGGGGGGPIPTTSAGGSWAGEGGAAGDGRLLEECVWGAEPGSLVPSFPRTGRLTFASLEASRFRVAASGRNAIPGDTAGVTTGQVALDWNQPVWRVASTHHEWATGAPPPLEPLPYAASGSVTAILVDETATLRVNVFDGADVEFPLPGDVGPLLDIAVVDDDKVAIVHGDATSPSMSTARFAVHQAGDPATVLETSEPIGCADRRVPTAGTRADGRTFVAVASHDAFAACAGETMGPPTALQLVVIGEDGGVVAESAARVDAVVGDVELAPRGQGAWLAVRDEEGEVVVATVDRDGIMDPLTRLHADPGFAIAAWNDGFAIVDDGPELEVRVRLYGAAGDVVGHLPAVPDVEYPGGRPAFLAAGDGASFALATFNRAPSDVYPQELPLLLLRADCDF